jgi:inosine/xanthosine triphosphate pyrophosphatase family protein
MVNYLYTIFAHRAKKTKQIHNRKIDSRLHQKQQSTYYLSAIGFVKTKHEKTVFFYEALIFIQRI